MTGRWHQKRMLRSNRVRGKKILRKAQLIARRNAININLPITPLAPVEANCVIAKTCPLQGCNGVGHLNGVDENHITLSGCPTFHNVSLKYCKEMRAREDGLALSPRKYNDYPKQGILTNNSDKSIKIREPSLDSLTSNVFLYQFRRAQQKLASDVDKEVHEHLIAYARVKEVQRKQSATPGSDTVADPKIANNIRSIIFGEWEMQTWYSSMYPPDVACLPKIYICEFCLTYMRHSITYRRHRLRCKRKFPPGNEIYRKGTLSFFEIDGCKQKEYCRNICLLAKLYLKQKTVHEIDRVSAFFFFVLTEADEAGCHIIGYFSKHKLEEQDPQPSSTFNNLSCLLILPNHQRQGYGRMIVEFSYLLSRLEGRIGSPERPLSDQGLVVYQRYWRWVVVSFLKSYQPKEVNVKDISEITGIDIRDIVSTLLDLGILKYIRTEYFIVNNKVELRRILSDMRDPKENRRIDPNCLKWGPHSNKT